MPKFKQEFGIEQLRLVLADLVSGPNETFSEYGKFDPLLPQQEWPPGIPHLVLTNRNVRQIGLSVVKGEFFIKSNVAIPLHNIQSLGVQRKPGGFFAQAQVDLSFTLAGGQVERWTSQMESAEPFAVALEQAFAERTAADQTVGVGAGVADEIAKLSELASEGAISSEEFERGKELFLGKPPDEAADKIALLRQLHSLHKSGVLSESEFNMKKWDLLSS